MSVIAADLGLSPSEVHAALKRLQQARLLHGPEMQDKPNLAALEEFLLHGLKYAFPAERGHVTRGVPTSYAAPPLRDDVVLGDELPPVWPWKNGDTRGIALEPLYRTAPAAALRDPALYELLALVDAIRDGRARERKMAERELLSRLRTANVKA
jgi:DNA-binding Lrp family transcriptional regulator